VPGPGLHEHPVELVVEHVAAPVAGLPVAIEGDEPCCCDASPVLVLHVESEVSIPATLMGAMAGDGPAVLRRKVTHEHHGARCHLTDVFRAALQHEDERWMRVTAADAAWADFDVASVPEAFGADLPPCVRCPDGQ